MTAATTAPATTSRSAPAPSGRSRLARLTAALGVVPFLGYLVIFLIVPTITVGIGAFVEEGRPSLAAIRDLADRSVLGSLANSLALSAVTAVIGAVVGALLAYAVVTGPADGL